MAEIVMRVAQSGSPPRRKKLAIFCPTCRCSADPAAVATALAAAAAGPGARTATASPAASVEAVSAAKRLGDWLTPSLMLRLELFKSKNSDSPGAVALEGARPAARCCFCSSCSLPGLLLYCMRGEEMVATGLKERCCCNGFALIASLGAWNRDDARHVVVVFDDGRWYAGRQEEDGAVTRRGAVGTVTKDATTASWPTASAQNNVDLVMLPSFLCASRRRCLCAKRLSYEYDKLINS